MPGWTRCRRCGGRSGWTTSRRRPRPRASRASVLVQVLPDVAETEEFLARAAASHGAGGGPVPVAGVVGWVDLCGPDVATEIARIRERHGGDRLVGIRHLVQDEPDPAWLDRPEVRRGLRAVGAGRAGLRPADPPVPAARRAPADRRGGPGAVRAGPRGQAADLRRRAGALGHDDRRAGGQAQRRLQGVRPGHRGGGGLAAGPVRPLRRRAAGQLRAGPAAVRVRLAGLPAGRYLRRGAGPGPRPAVAAPEPGRAGRVLRRQRPLCLQAPADAHLMRHTRCTGPGRSSARQGP